MAHGPIDEADRQALEGATLVVAADGGALALERWGRRPDILVGDFDSLSETFVARLAAGGARIERHPREKDQTDLELALRAARESGAAEIDLIGVLGGPRADLAFANLQLLAAPAWRSITLRALHGAQVVRPLHAGERLALTGAPRDLVSLVPLGVARGVHGGGLRYPLAGETLSDEQARGVSNEVADPPAWVSCDEGRLLVFEARPAAPEADPRTATPQPIR